MTHRNEPPELVAVNPSWDVDPSGPSTTPPPRTAGPDVAIADEGRAIKTAATRHTASQRRTPAIATRPPFVGGAAEVPRAGPASLPYPRGRRQPLGLSARVTSRWGQARYCAGRCVPSTTFRLGGHQDGSSQPRCLLGGDRSPRAELPPRRRNTKRPSSSPNRRSAGTGQTSRRTGGRRIAESAGDAAIRWATRGSRDGSEDSRLVSTRFQRRLAEVHIRRSL